MGSTMNGVGMKTCILVDHEANTRVAMPRVTARQPPDDEMSQEIDVLVGRL